MASRRPEPLTGLPLSANLATAGLVPDRDHIAITDLALNRPPVPSARSPSLRRARSIQGSGLIRVIFEPSIPRPAISPVWPNGKA